MDPKIKVDEFVRRLYEDVTKRGAHYTFFLGAGCSRTSGIDCVPSLTETWLKRLKEIRELSDDARIEEYDEKDLPAHTLEFTTLYT